MSWSVYAGLVYVVTCWGLNIVLVKGAISHLDPLAFTALRFLAMVPLTFLLVRATGQRVRIERRDAGALIACAAFGYGIYQYLWVLGLANTTAFANSLFGAMSPAFTLTIVALAGHERVTRMRWAGVAVAVLGVAVFEGAFAGRLAFRLGDVLSLLSSLSFAAYNVATARLSARYSPLTLVAITLTIGTLMVLPAGLPRLLHADLSHLGWSVWGPFAFAVCFPIVLTWPVWNYGISRLGAARVSLFGFLVPIVAGGLSVPLLGARLATYEIVGAAICIAGMAVAGVLGRPSLAEMWNERSLPIER